MSAYSDRIDRYMDAHPGASLAEARGHGSTPEHPSDDYARHDPRYEDYFERRDSYESHAYELKQDYYGNEEQWNAEGARESTGDLSMKWLEIADRYDDLETLYEDYPEAEDEFGHYH